MAANARLPYSTETIGVPIDFLILVPMAAGNKLDPLHHYTLAAPMSHTAFNALVELARRTDTPDAYFMHDFWARGTLIRTSGGARWRMKPGYAREMDVIIAQYKLDAETAKGLSASIHFKREKKVIVNPLNNQHDIVMFWNSNPEAEDRGGRWYDVTASNMPVMHMPSDPVPTRRPGHFCITDPADPRYKHACRYCCNRVPLTGKHLLKCARCQAVRYCSLACQRADWKAFHKHECVPKE